MGLGFVWVGDNEATDQSTIPDYHYLDDAAWVGGGETNSISYVMNSICGVLPNEVTQATNRSVT